VQEEVLALLNPGDCEGRPSTRESLNVASVNREVALLKNSFSKAVERRKLKESPARKV